MPVGRCAARVGSVAKEPSERPIITQYPIFDLLDAHIITLYMEIYMNTYWKIRFWLLACIYVCLSFYVGTRLAAWTVPWLFNLLYPVGPELSI